MKKGVIFDMDGLLFDTEAVWQRNWSRVAADMGIDLPEAFRKEICGTSGEIMKRVIEKYYSVDDGTEIMQNVINGVHSDLKDNVPEKPGLHEILEHFRNKGMKMAVASSSSQAQIESNCRNAGILEYFDALVSGAQIGKSKPAPDIFLAAAEKIGIAPEDCYVFEDAFNGVQAGYAAGSAVIMIPDMTAPTDEIRAMTYAVYDSLLTAKDNL
ncbi:MAG: HAD family phosphatase [Solobacterium sp.]|nr:HAD family phosphatase [Solobacterium sp.]